MTISKSSILQDFIPVRAIVVIPFSLHIGKASTIFFELPEVEIPIKTSPATPCAWSWRVNILSYP